MCPLGPTITYMLKGVPWRIFCSMRGLGCGRGGQWHCVRDALIFHLTDACCHGGRRCGNSDLRPRGKIRILQKISFALDGVFPLDTGGNGQKRKKPRRAVCDGVPRLTVAQLLGLSMVNRSSLGSRENRHYPSCMPASLRNITSDT